jgi:hypothetical protein
MKIRTDERYLGFDQWGITTKEAKTLCGKLPDHGREKLVANDDNSHYWIGRVTFRNDHQFRLRPVKYPFYATLTNWKIFQGKAILLANPLNV